MKVYLLIFFLLINISINYTPQIPSAYEIAPWHAWKQGAITYSFDDGCSNQINKAIPSLNKYGLKATFNLVTSWVSNWNYWKQASQNGHEIASHTITHANLNGAGENELFQSKQIIEQNIGKECVTIAYPNCNVGNKNTIGKYYISGRTCSGQLMSKNPGDIFELSSTIVGQTSSHNSANDLNKLAESAAQQNKWIVYLIHGVDDDGGYSPINSNALDQHFSYVKQADKWWVATFKDVSKYILESNSLVITETGNDSSGYLINVSCQYQTSLTKLDVPVTIARKVICSNPKVKQNGTPINSVPYNGKVIFDVIPGNKYSIQC